MERGLILSTRLVVLSQETFVSVFLFDRDYAIQLFTSPANSRELLFESFLVGTLGPPERSGTNAERH